MLRDLAPGDEVDGRYRLERRLGTGGMGEVFAAFDRERKQRVALKVFRKTALAQDVARERLLREGRAAARVAHPHVVRVHEVGAGELAYVTMELLEGEDLGERMDREGALPIAFCEQLARELTDALVAMHEAGVVHRDLKPKNVFLPHHGSLKVLDFGLAKAEFLGESLTDVQQVFGTLNYLAPEQLRSATLADQRSDVWAFATVLFEALTGQAAFPGRDAPQVVTSISTLDAPSVSRLRPETPPYLVEIVRRALRRDPTLRFQTASELREALERRDAPTHCAQTEELTAIVPTTIAAPTTRARWPAPLLLAKVVGLSVWLLHADSTNAERVPEPAPAQIAWPAQCVGESPSPSPVLAVEDAGIEEVKVVRRARRVAPARPAVSVPYAAPAAAAAPAHPSAAGELRRAEF
jgi:eukaryotic-like serine/threonine-protein kinase